MEKKANEIIGWIKKAFQGVRLEEGISWREADVIDSYGTKEERDRARALDEKNDWAEISPTLIGDLKYQNVIPYLDPKGLRFYLPPCMIFILNSYSSSASLIIQSVLYALAREEKIKELQKILNPDQQKCIR